jgi:hypothetical protein
MDWDLDRLRGAKLVTGRCDGKVVLLDEPVPIDGEIEVAVVIPSPAAGKEALTRSWSVLQGLGSQSARSDLMPSGLPKHPPSDQEWRQRATEVREMLERWIDEGPSEDLATWEELKAGLEAHPVRFREFVADE